MAATDIRQIFGLAAVFLVGILPHIIGSLSIVRRAGYFKSLTNSEQLIRYWSSSLSMIAVVLLVAAYQPEGLVMLGISDRGEQSGAILLGFIATLFYSIVIGYLQLVWQRIRKTPVEKYELDTLNPGIAKTIRFRKVHERIADVSLIPLAVIGEELVFRGYFVLFMGTLTGTFLPWIIVSILLSVVIHLYQGRDWKTILYHAGFAALCIAILISTHNIQGIILGHISYNLIWTLRTWQEAGKLLPPVQEEVKVEQWKVWGYFLFSAFNAGLIYLAWWAIQPR
jgi:membrane protease YdiL (CAAX protease family)